MINSYFKDRFPFAYDYFSKLLEAVKNQERQFPQAMIFEGSDIKSQYLFALELARILNCQNSGNNDCDCLNCKWIKSFSHPAINNVSQIHFKGEEDTSRTVISVKQAHEIEKSLSLSSDYHRFFIFFSSKEKTYSSFELEDFAKLGYMGDIDYSFEPLNFSTFHPYTPNALLKSIEEPPKRTTFIFLTDSRENILSTIVSRCFSFKLSSKANKINYSHILDIIEDYPNINTQKALYIADSFLNLTKDDISAEEILNEFLEYLKDMLVQNIDNLSFSSKIQNDISFIKNATKYLKANISDKLTFEGLMLQIARGY